VSIALSKTRTRYIVEALTMVGLVVATYFSISTINALPGVDDSLTASAAPRGGAATRGATTAARGGATSKGTGTGTTSQQSMPLSGLAGGTIQCGQKEPACDVHLTDLPLAEARPESVRGALAALATARCSDRDFRGAVDAGYGQFHRLYSNDGRYLGVIFVDRDVCLRSPIAVDDVAVWPAPGVEAARALHASRSSDQRLARAGPAEAFSARDATGERARGDPLDRQSRYVVGEEKRVPGCVMKPVMTDAELARCRSN
jgi:hypothetical protein